MCLDWVGNKLGRGVCRRERERWWQQDKQEAADYLERRHRLNTRMQQAHTSRIAKALASQWPAQTGITKYDVVAASVFAGGVALMSSFWLAPVEPKGTGGAGDVRRAADEFATAPEHRAVGRTGVTGAAEARNADVVVRAPSATAALSPMAAARLQALEDSLRSKASLASRSSDAFDESLLGVS